MICDCVRWNECFIHNTPIGFPNSLFSHLSKSEIYETEGICKLCACTSFFTNFLFVFAQKFKNSCANRIFTNYRYKFNFSSPLAIHIIIISIRGGYLHKIHPLNSQKACRPILLMFLSIVYIAFKKYDILLKD
jgi:hypothetical protein